MAGNGSTGPRGARGIRLNPTHDAKTRAKIRTSQIINRLEKFILRECDEDGVVVEMAPHQVTAALGLLRKTLPDLANVDMNVNGRVDVVHHDGAADEIVSRISRLAERTKEIGCARTVN